MQRSAANILSLIRLCLKVVLRFSFFTPACESNCEINRTWENKFNYLQVLSCVNKRLVTPMSEQTNFIYFYNLNFWRLTSVSFLPIAAIHFFFFFCVIKATIEVPLLCGKLTSEKTFMKHEVAPERFNACHACRSWLTSGVTACLLWNHWTIWTLAALRPAGGSVTLGKASVAACASLLASGLQRAVGSRDAKGQSTT